MEDFKIIAHRGASGHAPENTLAAIKKALEIGAHAVEIDIHQTQDNRIVVIHDETLERTTTGIGSIKSKTYDELRKLDAGSWFAHEFTGERIPLLEEVFETIGDKAELIIELKNGSQVYPKIESNLWALIRENGFENSTVVSSSRVTVLNTLKKIAPSARLGKVIAPRELWRTFFQPGSFFVKNGLINHLKELHPHWTFIDHHLMELAKSHDLKVIPWTLNKERKIRAMIDRGVHGVITDYPEIAFKVI